MKYGFGGAGKIASMMFLITTTALSSAAAYAQSEFASQLENSLKEIEVEYWPDVRWWLAEGLNTDATLRKNVQEIYDSGFGSFEFLAMPEPSADSSIYGWGSEEWTADSRTLIEEATKRGMGFSLTSGTHWATANLPDTYTWRRQTFNLDNRAASKELDYATILLAAGESFDAELPKPVVEDKFAEAKEYVLQGVVAAKIVKPRPGAGQDNNFAEGEETGLLDLASMTDITGTAAGDGKRLSWTAPDDGQYAIFVYWLHGTGQTSVPSVATNYAVNYIDRFGIEAMIDYWDEIVMTDDLKRLIRENGRGEMYMDSLELASYGAGGTLWGYEFKEEFRTRRGYDITPYMPFLTMDTTRVRAEGLKPFDYYVRGEEQMAQVDKVRNDFHRTLTDMYLENVLRPLQAWLHEHDMTLRAEPSYGTVMEISLPAKYLDGVETESFAQNADIDLFRGMLGAANMYGRPFSSETGAVRNRNYVYNMDYWTQLMYQQFVGGVNRTVLHGYSAIEGSEGDTLWPGHEGMYAHYSERFNSRQPAAAQYPEWTQMIARNQKVLREGRPLRDIAILRTDNFFPNYGQPPAYYPSENGYMMHDLAYFWRDMGLQEAGYTYDYFSPQLLEDEENIKWSKDYLQPAGPAYKAIVLFQTSLELSGARQLLEIAQSGLPVLFVNNAREMTTHDAALVQHGVAGSVSKFLDDSDKDLRAVVDKIKALPNVRTLDSQAEAVAALAALDVAPRVGYGRPNNSLLTISRMNDERNTMFTFVYSYKHEVDRRMPAQSYRIEIEGEGKPYFIDDWTGRVSEAGAYEIEEGRTVLELTMKPGEARLVALDLEAGAPGLHALATTADAVRVVGGDLFVEAAESGSYQTRLSDGSTVVSEVSAPAAISLDRWDIVIEDWNAGKKVVNTEKKFGHATAEAYYKTAKAEISVPDSALAPWKDLKPSRKELSKLAGKNPSMAHVSGVGRYAATFERPADWDETVGAYLEIDSTGGSLADVYVNGRRAGAFNPRTPKVNISDLVRPGENTVEIVVSTTLTNRLYERGYASIGNWDHSKPLGSARISGMGGVGVQNYGLTGNIRVQPFVLTALD